MTKWMGAWLLGLAIAFVSSAALAQAPAATKEGGALSDADRARRDASKVFSFIKFQAVRARAPSPAAAGGGAPVAPVAVAANPVASQDRSAEQVLAKAAPQVSAPLATTDSAAESDPAALLAASPTAAGPGGTDVAVAAAAAAVAKPIAPPLEAKTSPTPAPPPEPEELVELALIHHEQPVVPPRQLANARSGSVMVQFTVQPDGKTHKVFARPGAQLVLARAAIRAVEQWRFEPISEAREVMVEVAFKLD
jgi:TonB family protein